MYLFLRQKKCNLQLYCLLLHKWSENIASSIAAHDSLTQTGLPVHGFSKDFLCDAILFVQVTQEVEQG